MADQSLTQGLALLKQTVSDLEQKAARVESLKEKSGSIEISATEWAEMLADAGRDAKDFHTRPRGASVKIDMHDYGDVLEQLVRERVELLLGAR